MQVDDCGFAFLIVVAERTVDEVAQMLLHRAGGVIRLAFHWGYEEGGLIICKVWHVR